MIHFMYVVCGEDYELDVFPSVFALAGKFDDPELFLDEHFEVPVSWVTLRDAFSCDSEAYIFNRKVGNASNGWVWKIVKKGVPI